MDLIGQKVYIKEQDKKQAIIGEIVRQEGTKLFVKLLMFLSQNGKSDYSHLHMIREYSLYELDRRLQIIWFKDLVNGRQFGGAALDIYKMCIYVLGFDASKTSLFVPHTNVYAESATKEGYDVWFICNSNFYTSGGSTRWNNIISEDWETIKEAWIRPEDEMTDSGNNRVVFIKYRDGKYYFSGIYKLEEFNKESRYKIYKRFETSYPIKKK